MPFISSPIAYPESSSPRDEPCKKRKRTDTGREPLKDIAGNSESKLVAGFVLEDSDSEDEGLGLASSPLGADQLRRNEGALQNDSAQDIDIDEGFQECVVDDGKDHDSPHQDEGSPEVQLSTDSAPQYQLRREYVPVQTCSGRLLSISKKLPAQKVPYEELVASRSTTVPGKAQRSYYGIDIHRLIDEARAKNTLAQQKVSLESDQPAPQVPAADPANSKTLLWTEKYRAKKFTDLVGDERTHRAVLRWLKGWDPIVFPGARRPKSKTQKESEDAENHREHRKVLLLSGPPGLGKTTLAHVCAKQAGYEVQEINASDERSRDVVKGRIRDMVGTENVRSIDSNPNNTGKRKVARPVCVVVDEVDGVVGGSGGAGDGGFMKGLAELIALDQKNLNASGGGAVGVAKRKRKGDNFRLLRPLILICNDAYHPSLRALRQSAAAEFIHIRKPPLNLVTPRLKSIFEKEGVDCDGDGVRHLCEAAWGVSSRKGERSMGDGTGEGDMRGILVVGEWVAGKLRAQSTAEESKPRLTKRWVEQNILGDLAHGGGAARSIGRGGSKELVERIFLHNAGFPAASKQSGAKNSGDYGAVDTGKQRALDRLKEMIMSSGEDDRIVTECFSSYPSQPIQDDTFLTKPCQAYDWLHFHDTVSSLVHSSHEWELAPYLSHAPLAFHHLFASPTQHSTHATTTDDANADASRAAHPLTGPRADHAAHEAHRANRETLQHLHAALSLPLHRAFRSLESVTADLLPYVVRILSPDVKPVVVGGAERGVASVRRASEREMVARGVQAMIACGVRFEKGRLDNGSEGPGAAGAPPQQQMGSVYRMEPALDALSVFETAQKGLVETVRVRYAVRQVLEQEWRKEVAKKEQDARMRRAKGVSDEGGGVEDVATSEKKAEETAAKGLAKAPAVKRDFFGRPLLGGSSAVGSDSTDASADTSVSVANKRAKTERGEGAESRRIWVSYHEGFSNAVRKPITLKELMEGL